MLSKELIKMIVNCTNLQDYKKGAEIPPINILNISTNPFRGDIIEYLYQVKSTSRHEYYFVTIKSDKQNIKSVNCTCPKFSQTFSCKHIAACLIYNIRSMIKNNSKEDNLKKSKMFFQDYLESIDSKPKQKSEVFIEFNLIETENYWHNYFYLSGKIGISKLYNLNNKLKAFLHAYINNSPYKFGKDFIYDPDIHYFSEKNKMILNFLVHNQDYINSYGISLDDENMKVVLPLLNSSKLYIDNYLIREWTNESPFKITLKKQENNYIFQISKTKDITPLTDDYEYSYLENTIYHTDAKILKLINKMHSEKLKQLTFLDEDLDLFSKTVLPIVKKEIELDPKIENIKIDYNPNTNLYFEILNDQISAEIKFVYKDQEINYFEKTKEILRDHDYENTVISDLYSFHFENTKEKFILEDLEDIVDFLENGLNILSEKYQVFTSERLKNISINKNTNINATFSIGSDNIMRFDFDLGNLSEEDLSSILSSLKQKKKYYRLKSGDFLSLEDENLKELNNLVDDLDLDYEDILRNNGEIPKYYALYLASKEKNGSHIIKTNNEFQKFIENFLEYQNLKIKWEKNEKNILRDYQQIGVKWLYTLYKCGFGGILADEMGLGKSLQTIIFFKKVLEEKQNSKFLIVVPTSLVYNWQNEFLKFAPDIKLELINGPKNIREDKIKSLAATVFVTTYGLLREDLELYNDKEFEICAIDEAQNIKNPKAGLTKAVKKIKANNKMALTGTPVENSVVELWSIFDFLMPGFLSSLVKFQEKNKEMDNLENNSFIKNLKEQIAPFILRRKKEDVAKDLPPKIENTIYIDLTEEEKKIYAAEVQKVRKEIESKIQESGFKKAQFEILPLITHLRQLCISPKIRYENFLDTSSKLDNLIKIIKESTNNGHKILLFSNFRTALDLVREELNENDIKSYTIDGSVNSKKRMELVTNFNQDKTPIFLIMLKSGGTGLNLTSADVVIHLDLWWNPQAENQATDRTHRIGQTKTVEVIKLIAKGTIEERILELQEKKKKLSNELIENNSTDTEIFNKLTEDDIKNLLSFEKN